MRDSFVFYKGMKNAIEKAPKENRLELYEALLDYAFEDKEPDQFMSQMLVEAFKPSMEKARKRYEAQVENGKKGGRPKKDETQINPNKPKKPMGKNENLNDTVTGTGTETGTDNENENGNEAKIAFLDCVHLAPAQHQELLKTFGETKTAELIQILNDYKASKGKTYKSDYHAIKSWVLKKYDEDRQKQEQSPQSPQTPAKSRFQNYEGRKWDHDTLMKLEKEYIERKVNKILSNE